MALSFPFPLRFFLVCALLATNGNARAQLLEETEGGPRKGRYVPVNGPTAALKNAIYTRTYRNKEGSYQKGPSSSFDLIEEAATITNTWKVGKGKPILSGQNNGEPVQLPDAAESITLIPHEKTLYGKINTKLPAFGAESGIVIEHSGTYEMEVLAGSWKEYQNGGQVTVEIAMKDLERYAGEIAKAYQHPGFIAFASASFKKTVIADLEKAIKERPEIFFGSTATPEQIQTRRNAFYQTVISVSPSVSTSSPTYRFRGDTMISLTREFSLNLLHQSHLPGTPEAQTVDKTWLDRYNLRLQSEAKPEDFEERPESPQAFLPGYFLPKWEQQKP